MKLIWIGYILFVVLGFNNIRLSLKSHEMAFVTALCGQVGMLGLLAALIIIIDKYNKKG